MFDIQNDVQQWLAAGTPVALATVAKTWGSAPRAVGAKMAVTADLAMAGSVSGGCIEGAVVEASLDVLRTGRPTMLEFGVGNDDAWEVGLTCGGEISVFIEPLNAGWWRALLPLASANRRAVTVTLIDGDLAGAKVLQAAGAVKYESDGLAPGVQAALVALGSSSAPGRVTHTLGNALVDIHAPQPTLIIVGGVHIAIPLQRMAREAGWRVVLVDPRRAFASDARFGELDNVLHSYPDEALAQVGLDADTFVASLTHDPKIDDPALIAALASPAAYVGVLSSRKTHETRLERLREAGVPDDQLARIYTPVGLDIGAANPEEIAVSILAELIAVRRGRHPRQG